MHSGNTEDLCRLYGIAEFAEQSVVDKSLGRSCKMASDGVLFRWCHANISYYTYTASRCIKADRYQESDVL